MPRKPSYWNNLPRAIYADQEDADAFEVLIAWGVTSWGRTMPSDVGDYVGWHRVHLPDGWMLSLEGRDFFLLDQHGQVRAEIYDAFERPERNVIKITDKDIEEAGISKETWKEAFPPDRKPPEKPRMVLRTAIRFRSSFSLASTHSFWLEDSMGQKLFGIFDEPVLEEEYDEKVPRLRKRVMDWANEHFPDWQNHTAYWDTFVEPDERWPLTHQDIISAVTSLLADKTDDDLQALREEMGVGEKFTDYLVALQSKLAAMFNQPDDTFPFFATLYVTGYVKREMEQRIGFEDC